MPEDNLPAPFEEWVDAEIVDDPRNVDLFGGWPLYYDKQGRPISIERMSELKYDTANGGQSDYARIGLDEFDGLRVSTVWLGIDHGFHWRAKEAADYKPVIFETMIFGGDFHENQWRYCTEEEAARGHLLVVGALRAGIDPSSVGELEME